MVGCADEANNLKIWQKAFAMHETRWQEFMKFLNQDVERRGQAQEYRKGHPVKRGTLWLRGRQTSLYGWISKTCWNTMGGRELGGEAF